MSIFIFYIYIFLWKYIFKCIHEIFIENENASCAFMRSKLSHFFFFNFATFFFYKISFSLYNFGFYLFSCCQTIQTQRNDH